VKVKSPKELTKGKETDILSVLSRKENTKKRQEEEKNKKSRKKY